MDESPRLTTVLRPVRAGNAFEETVERLLQAIKLGVTGPETWLAIARAHENLGDPKQALEKVFGDKPEDRRVVVVLECDPRLEARRVASPKE